MSAGRPSRARSSYSDPSSGSARVMITCGGGAGSAAIAVRHLGEARVRHQDARRRSARRCRRGRRRCMRTFRGTSTAPAAGTAKCSSSSSGTFGRMAATRSPGLTPLATSAPATRAHAVAELTIGHRQASQRTAGRSPHTDPRAEACSAGSGASGMRKAA